MVQGLGLNKFPKPSGFKKPKIYKLLQKEKKRQEKYKRKYFHYVIALWYSILNTW